MKNLIRLTALAIGLLLAVSSADVRAQSLDQTPEQGQVLNLREADIRAFIDDVAMMTGRTFIVDPRVTGRVTVLSNAPVSEQDVLDIFMATLSVHGFTAIPTETGTYKIVPEDNVAQQAGPVDGEQARDTQFVTRVFHMDTMDPVGVLNLVRPLVNQRGTVVANRGGNALIVVDTAANMQRIAEIIEDVDTDDSVTRTVSLANTGAREMATVATDILGRVDGDTPRRAVDIVPVPSSNMLLLRGEQETVERLAETVREIDANGGRRNDLKVISLKHADAEQLVPILETMSASLAAAAPAEDGGGTGRANIAFDKGTNSLIIGAEPSMQATLADVIAQLDVRRFQVLVEAIIVEVSDTAARELGLQFVLAGTEGSKVPFTVANYSNTAPNILAVTGAILSEQDDNPEDSDTLDDLRSTAIDSLLGVNGFAIGAGGRTDSGALFGVILNALQQDVASNVLSTPSVMTMNNEDASIIVGQEIPITTGESLGSDNSNPFRTIERQDVGVQLDVRPQITEGDAVKLFIRQEVSSVAGPLTEDSVELITNIREIETTVLVDDGEIIVLGGLIQSDEQTSVNKIPLLGDIPILGRAFRSEGRSRVRTNLMIFLRPTIVRGAEDMREATEVKYRYIRAEQLQRDDKGTTIDDFMDEVMGAAPPVPAPAPGETGGGNE